MQTSEQCIEDLAHAFDLTSSVVAARAPLESALERRETPGLP
jgi:succinate dehydrogenase / fumarate reductase flavoprotein subunit